MQTGHLLLHSVGVSEPNLTHAVLREVDYSLPERPPDAVRVADDCIRLFETPEGDFPSAREQTWYRRLWSSLGRENLVLVGTSCRHLDQARSFVLELLRLITSTSPHGDRLLGSLQDELDHIETRRGNLGPGLSRLRSEVRKLAERLALRQVQLADERGLPEKLRVLLVRAMIAAAWADGSVSDEEVALLTRKIESLGLSRPAQRQVLAEIRDPTPLDEDLSELGDYGLRLHVYRNLAAVAVADGRVSLAENLLLAHLAQVLRIEEPDAARVEAELFSLVSTRGLRSLVESVAGGSTGAVPGGESGPATSVDPQAAPGIADSGTADAGPPLAGVRGLWLRLAMVVGQKTSWSIFSGLSRRLGRLAARPPVEEILSLMRSDVLATELSDSIDGAVEFWTDWLGTLREPLGIPDRTVPNLAPALAEALRSGLRPMETALGRLAGTEKGLDRALSSENRSPGSYFHLMGDPRQRGGLLHNLLSEPERHRAEEAALQAYFKALQQVLASSELAGDHMEQAAGRSIAAWLDAWIPEAWSVAPGPARSALLADLSRRLQDLEGPPSPEAADRLTARR